MSSSTVTLRPAEHADTRAVVQTHLASFDGFFLSTLGPRFLRLFYEGMIDVESGVLIVAVDGNRIVGFVGGATEQIGFYGSLLKTRAIRFAFAAAVAGLRTPTAIPRLIRARQRSSGHADTPLGSCLMTLGVLPGQEGRGIGQSLVNEFESEISRIGERSYCLTTDADKNDRTNRFYESLGFVRTRVITTPEGRQLNEYRRSW